MKKQFYLIPILFLALFSQSIAQSTNPIATYQHFDAIYGDELIQMTFCETDDINLTVDENENQGAPFVSFEWFYLGQDGSETSIGEDSPNFTSNDYGPGYHVFRVYGYSAENQTGCYEITDIAVYVLPNLPLTAQGVVEDYCTTDFPPIVADGSENSKGLGAIVLDATIDQSGFPDTYELNYVWSKSIDGGQSAPIEGANSPTYIVGSASTDDHSTIGVHTYSVVVSYEVNNNGCPTEEIIMAVITVTPAPEKPVINVNGGHRRP